MVTTINKFKDEASGKLFDKEEDACASEYKYIDIRHAFNFYDEVEDCTCSFSNGAYCVQRDEDVYNRLLDTLIKCIRQYHPALAANYLKEVGTFERDDVKGHSFVGRWLSDNSDPLYKWWYVQCNICPVCFREYGQPYYALNCKHDDSIPTRDDVVR